jgi:lysyl-tRNA synthetase class I
MSTTRTLSLVAAGLLALTTGHGLAGNQKDAPKADPPSLPNEAQVMQVKLKRSQAIVEALVKEDFKTLEESAASLVRISKATEFLRAYKTEEYEFQTRVFQKSAEALAAKAKEKNLDGATLAYMDMTMSCVACHNHFRGRKRD